MPECATADSDAVTATFTRDSLGKVCTLVRSISVDAGVASQDIEDLLIVVSELATNAIRYAGGSGWIELRRESAGLLTKIHDNGPGLPDDLVVERPSSDAMDGRGLWLARLLCANLDIVSSAQGVTVRIMTPYGSAPTQISIDESAAAREGTAPAVQVAGGAGRRTARRRDRAWP